MNKPYILCVDDDKSILISLKAQLQHNLSEHFRFEMAQSASEAWEVINALTEEGEQVAVVISDYIMPGTKGDELLIKIHQRYPKIVNIMLTGHADNTAIQQAYEQANLAACFGKPWEIEDILDCLREHVPGL